MYPNDKKRKERLDCLNKQLLQLLDDKRLLERRIELLQHEKKILLGIDKIEEGQQTLEV